MEHGATPRPSHAILASPPGERLGTHVGERRHPALELVPDDSQQVSCVYPKTWYTWTDRMGITKPDVTGPYQLANLTPVSTADAGTLVITADCTTAGAIIGLAVVLWDERGNPISISNGNITASGWATNAAGTYVASSGYSMNAGLSGGRCQPGRRLQRTGHPDFQWHHELAHQALLIVGRGRIVGRGAWGDLVFNAPRLTPADQPHQPLAPRGPASDDLIGQEPQRGDAGDVGAPAVHPRLEPAEPACSATEQAQSDDKPDHEPSRQSGAEGAILAGTGQDLFHPCARDDTFQSVETLLSGPRRERVSFLADIDHRSLLASYRVVANSCWQEAFFLARAVERSVFATCS